MSVKDQESTLRAGLAELGQDLDNGQISQLLEFLDLLQKWNKAYNLTAIDNPREMVALHLLDSLAILPYLQGNRFIDVGTGPGLPGIPLAIACPDKHFSLLDSNGKRVRFLFQVKVALGLQNIEEIHARSEAYQPKQCFDGVISRAFTALPDMVDKTRHLLTDNGVFYAMKGRMPEKELSDLPKPYNVSSCYPLTVPGVEAERHLVTLTIPESNPVNQS
jgi:16S rRNA (guanine(527)-N(7))-methyltransferase GidB